MLQVLLELREEGAAVGMERRVKEAWSRVNQPRPPRPISLYPRGQRRHQIKTRLRLNHHRLRYSEVVLVIVGDPNVHLEISQRQLRPLLLLLYPRRVALSCPLLPKPKMQDRPLPLEALLIEAAESAAVVLDEVEGVDAELLPNRQRPDKILLLRLLRPLVRALHPKITST